MRRLMTGLVGLLVVAGSLVVGTQAAQATTANIYCIVDWQCPHVAYANGDYWMTKQYDDVNWTRLTKVAGLNNTNVAPITCETKSVCRLQYYDASGGRGYWMAERDNVWVRLTAL